MNTLELDHPRSRTALRTVQRLVGLYVAISVLTVVAIALLRHHSNVNSAVWTRGTIVAAVSLLTLLFAVRAAHGHPRAFLRLRLVTAIQVVAIAVIISLPGTFPVALKIEQGVCGLVLIGVVVITNGKRLRSVFGAR